MLESEKLKVIIPGTNREKAIFFFETV